MRAFRRAVCLVAILSMLLTAGGCGKLELNQMAMVMAVGLDKEKNGPFKVTAQIVRPSSARGESGGPSGGQAEPVWTVSAEGSSIFEAIRNMGRFTSRRIFWAHNRVIVVGQDLAKEDISEVIDFFTRNHELRMNTWIVATPGKASELVSTDTGLEVIPGDSIDRLFRFSRVVSEAPRTTIKEVGDAYLDRSTNPVMAMVKKNKHLHDMDKPNDNPKKPQVELSGTAVFRKNKMIGTLSPSESRGLMFFIEKLESSVVSLPCPEDPKRSVSLELDEYNFNVTPGYQNERVSFRIKLHMNFDLVEMGCPAPKGTEAAAKALQEKAAAKYKSDIEAVLNKATKVYKTDFLELGKVFENRHPGIWKKLSPNWSESFSDAKTEVEVTAEINNPVLLVLPTKPLGGDKGVEQQ